MGKEKKEKVTYIDDGRTIADMSGVGQDRKWKSRPQSYPSPKFKEVWKTYWNATKMMFVPMLVAMGAIVVIYLLMTLAFYLM